MADGTENSGSVLLNELESTIGISPSSDDYYPTVAVGSLIKILRDSSLSSHHTAVVTAIMYIFKTLGLKCVPFMPQVKCQMPKI